MMSYMSFNRNVQIQNVQSIIDSRADLGSASSMGSPPNRSRPVVPRQKQREGLYNDEEGKNVDYKDRVAD